MEGRVTRADGSPLADVEVSIGTQTTETDSSGRYKVIGLQPGPTTIKAERDLYMVFEAELNLFSGVNELDITLRGESRLIGRITDAATGNGVPAEVSVGFTSSTANGNGDFRIEGLVAGNVVVNVIAPGYGRETRSATLEEGEETLLEVELRRAGEVVGTITNEAGTGLSGAVVSTPGAVAVSDMLGSYRLENVQAGMRELTVFKAGFDPKVLTLNVTSGTATTQNVVLAPVGPGTYRGRVTSVDSGMGVAGVQVRLNVGGTRTTDQNGDFEFLGLESGIYTATFTADGFVSKNGSVVVQSGATTNRNERLKETTQCVVQVLDATTGTPLMGASVLGGYEDGALGYALSYPFIANTGINGVASSSCPSDAVITWRVSSSGFYYYLQQAVVSAGNTSFAVQLARHPIVRGKVTGPGGVNEANASVAIIDSSGNVMGTSSTLPNGDFEVNLSGSGAFTLFVSKSGFQSAVRSISVPYTGTITVNVELQRP